MPGETLLEVDDLSVFYGSSQALGEVSLDVDEGEIVSVIGPNGAGKTTLLESMSGLLPYEGSVRYQGQEVSERNVRALVGDGLLHCTEDRDLFPFFTVHQNLLMGGQRLGRSEREERLDYVYDLFPRLDERRSQEAETMSGGEQQMLAIGRALMGDPDLLMLDEPTQGLAPVIIEDISDAVEELRSEGLTLLLAEQNTTFAMQHADRLYLVETGTIELSGTDEEFKNNDYVRDAYIGIT
ncbi:ABC transporter ATP-binding protein [Halorientalis sp.]|uniref:ABC transporter ATP-binding protein n=1 Tax=Halorientalis sp. TaxID=1931229 RepID=UPI002609CB9C|nr:ABC transporter ATP-binding protein [Halorientalis sp.]